jgi:hypothetical protein
LNGKNVLFRPNEHESATISAPQVQQNQPWLVVTHDVRLWHETCEFGHE